MPENSFDIQVTFTGSFFMVMPLTKNGGEWMAESIGDFVGAIVVEHRYIDDIVQSARDDGLEVDYS